MIIYLVCEYKATQADPTGWQNNVRRQFFPIAFNFTSRQCGRLGGSVYWWLDKSEVMLGNNRIGPYEDIGCMFDLKEACLTKYAIQKIDNFSILKMQMLIKALKSYTMNIMMTNITKKMTL